MKEVSGQRGFLKNVILLALFCNLRSFCYKLFFAVPYALLCEKNIEKPALVKKITFLMSQV